MEELNVNEVITDNINEVVEAGKHTKIGKWIGIAVAAVAAAAVGVVALVKKHANQQIDMPDEEIEVTDEDIESIME